MALRQMKHLLSYMAAATLLTACIKNDIPYPYIEGVIQSIEVDDIQGEAKIDPLRRTVEITVGEEAILNELTITKLVANTESEIIPDATACANAEQFPHFSFTSPNDLPANANTIIDFSKPVTFLLKTYQEYLWTVKVTQNISRAIEVEHQVGEAQFDVQNKRAIVYVESGTDLTDIHITRMNLEGSSAEVTPDPSTVTDFSRSQTFSFTKKGKHVNDWQVDVQITEITGRTGSVEAWARKATLYGGMRSGSTPTVEYKKASESNWTTLDAAAVTTTSSTSFKAELTGLTDGTTYEWRVTVNGQTTDPATFETERIATVANLDFDTWTQDGKNWFPNNDKADSYWATGNTGVTTLKDANTIPVEGSNAVSGKAARLETISVALVGSAAGNLFIGEYKTNLTNPSSSPKFGRPFTGARPTGLKGFYKYTPAAISNNGTIPSDRKLKTDECHIYIKIWDANGNMFGYGEFVGTEQVTAYTPFEFDIKYSDRNARPASMSIVITSSRYGGEFEGMKVVGQVGHGSTLYVDEFELLYD